MEWLHSKSSIIAALEQFTRAAQPRFRRSQLHHLWMREDVADPMKNWLLKLNSLEHSRLSKRAFSERVASLNLNDSVHQGLLLQCSPISLYDAMSLGRVNLKEYQHTLLMYDRQHHSYSSTQRPVWLACDGITDPQNFGAILRSAHYFNVQGIIIPHRQHVPLSSTVSRASSGALEYYCGRIYRTGSMTRFLKDSRAQGWAIIGTECEEGPKVKQIEEIVKTVSHQPTVLVMGSEGTGLRHGILDVCSHLATIQRLSEKDSVDSLNVSVACAILLHSLTYKHG